MTAPSLCPEPHDMWPILTLNLMPTATDSRHVSRPSQSARRTASRPDRYALSTLKLRPGRVQRYPSRAQPSTVRPGRPAQDPSTATPIRNNSPRSQAQYGSTLLARARLPEAYPRHEGARLCRDRWLRFLGPPSHTRVIRSLRGKQKQSEIRGRIVE
jgi:hypothetical protein